MVASLSPESAPKNRTSVELHGEREIIISRTFNAPARIVFDAWTRPEFVKRWWAPQSLCVTLVGCEADVRVGGAYRYQLRTPDGNAFAFSGRYTEITPPSRLVYTQVFEPMAEAGEMRITVTFDEREGKTHLVSHEVYPSAEARAGALASGMETGMLETMDQLDALVASLR
ncbi:SRPBCC family protein [Archangium primigenium]|uniref:SRPBCC family protein n=1 Tax=[Archangium] primigenium TaxID=2792470 RepID=UPI0019578FDA|nr:SRPBCC family protein [Archangium primigenium]MBM7117104.1 SRPBCC family protein [Archangium primigenium]